MLKTKIINQLWLLNGKSHYKHYTSNSRYVNEVQLLKLKSYLRKNELTQFGDDHEFRNIFSYEEYIRNVPISDWNYLKPYVDKIAHGETAVLTQEKVIRFEATSGTTNASKLIPYTKTLLSEYQQGINCWMQNLYKKNSKIC